MSVNDLARNKEKYDKFFSYWKAIAENNMYLQHTDSSMHFVRHDLMRVGAAKIDKLKSPYMGLEDPMVTCQLNTHANIQWIWHSAIVIAREVTVQNETNIQAARTEALVIIQSILSKFRHDRANNKLVYFDFESIQINPVNEHFRNCVGYRMSFKLPSQFDLTFNPDEWQNESGTAEPMPFATVNDQGEIITLAPFGAHTCSAPVPGTAFAVNSNGDIIAQAVVPSNTPTNLNLPDVTNVDSDGTDVPTPNGVPFVATLFTPAVFKLNTVTVGSAGSGGQLNRRIIRPTGVTVSTFDGIDANIVANSPIIQNGGTIDSTGAEQAFQLTTLLDEIAENGIYDANTKTLRFTSVLPTPKNTAMLLKTGQTISSFLHDDGYYQIGRPTSALVLSQLNPIGTYARFYLIPSTNIVCDFSLVDAETGQFIMYDKSDVTTGRAIAAHGLYGATKTSGPFTGWMPVMRRMLEWLRTDGQTWAWNNSPFNFNGSGIGDYLTTNTIVHSSAGTQIWMHYNYNGPVYSQARGVTESLPTMFCRVGNISEL